MLEKNEFDCVVVGGGPAGCSAALTLRNRAKSVLMCYSDAGALEKAHEVDNYPGLPRISGSEMTRVFREQARDAGILLFPHPVRQILPLDETTYSVLAGEEIVTAHSLILAVGTPRRASIPGESEGAGRGVSYCATCDGMFYKGRTVAVIGAFPEAAEEANFLSSLAARTLYFSEKPHDISALGKTIEKIEGRVTGIELKDGHVSSVKTRDASYPADGVFILRPAAPMEQLLPGLEMKDGRIAADREGRTNLPRVYAAGDALGAPYQIAKAVGDGNVAALRLCAEMDGK